MNVCDVKTVAMVVPLTDFEPYGIIFMTMCVYYFNFPLCLTGNLLVPYKIVCLHSLNIFPFYM
jgi:hypothetical protein